ncbi:protein yellow-like [Chelonus insularis]|uniref:protein yellow-like n=1 Tax=Chelonus insularis TaxID=460826 RepID=UPI00158A7201|nr:protein yellow-like [Chelonus insularis]
MTNRIIKTVKFFIILSYFFNYLSAYRTIPRYDFGTTNKKLKLIHSWKTLDFDFGDDHARQKAIESEEFIPGAPVPIDVDVANMGTSNSRIFITIPRFQKGVPATLGYIPHNNALTRQVNDPIIIPYPNWGRNRIGNCDNLVSVYRIKVDECGRLWVLDTGKLVDDQICPPKLLKFDLNTDTSTTYIFPQNKYKSSSLFITPAVDIRGQCNHTFVYIADVTGFQLIVYDDMNKKSWSIENNLFYPYPDYGSFTIAGESFNLMDGIFGLALGPLTGYGDRMLYFHSLASVVESQVRTSIIRNSSLFENYDNDYAVSRLFSSFRKGRSSQAGAQAMDKYGVLFYGLMSDTAIGCWNSKSHPEFGGKNLDVLVVDTETLQFVSGLKIITAPDGRDELWVITPSFQKVMTGSLNPREINFRIQAAYTNELVVGTKCAASSTFFY